VWRLYLCVLSKKKASPEAEASELAIVPQETLPLFDKGVCYQILLLYDSPHYQYDGNSLGTFGQRYLAWLDTA